MMTLPNAWQRHRTANAPAQHLLAYLQGIPPQRTPALRACTPARAGYGADLRDAALAASGATAKLVQQPVTFTMQGQPYSCMVNGQNFVFPDPAPIDLPLGSAVEWNVSRLPARRMRHARLPACPKLVQAPWFQPLLPTSLCSTQVNHVAVHPL